MNYLQSHLKVNKANRGRASTAKGDNSSMYVCNGKTLNTKCVDIKYLDRVAKRIEKENLKRDRRSLTWCSLLGKYFNDCIIEIYDNTSLIIDDDKLKEAKKAARENIY